MSLDLLYQRNKKMEVPQQPILVYTYHNDILSYLACCRHWQQAALSIKISQLLHLHKQQSNRNIHFILANKTAHSSAYNITNSFKILHLPVFTLVTHFESECFLTNCTINAKPEPDISTYSRGEQHHGQDKKSGWI